MRNGIYFVDAILERRESELVGQGELEILCLFLVVKKSDRAHPEIRISRIVD